MLVADDCDFRTTERRQGQLHESLLTDDSIRLLYVGKRRREIIRNARKERLLDCCIYVRPLPRPGRMYSYNALSYHWGPADNRHTILCNDQFIQVPSSLYEALSQYRISNQDKPLWVDALCIDQDNLLERNHQVHLMTEIYELADLVIAWLGRSTPEIELAFERLAYGRPPWEKTDIVCETEMSHGEVIVMPSRDQACRARYLQSRVEKGLKQLFTKPWFERCWVFQEILLARRAVLWCGLLEMDWLTFVRHCDELEDGNESMDTRIYDLCNTVVLNVEKSRASFWSRSDRPSLSKILIDTWQRKATDDRDQIFSVLGLVEGTVLQADYSLTARDTYMAAARACILEDQHLGILCLTELSQTETMLAEDRAKVGLPSWVPRWGSPGEHTRLRGISSFPDFGFLSMSPRAKQRLLRDPNELALQGVAIGYLEKSKKPAVSLELRPFVRCAPCNTNQSLLLDQMLCLERPEEQDQVIDMLEAMSYYYRTGACHCTGAPTYCIANDGLPCNLSRSAPSELPTLSVSSDWVCAVRGGTGYLVLRPKLNKLPLVGRPRYVFTLIGVTSYTLTGRILSALRPPKLNLAPTEVSLSTTIWHDWIFRAMEIIVA